MKKNFYTWCNLSLDPKDPESSASTLGYEECYDHRIDYLRKYDSGKDILDHTSTSLPTITLVAHLGGKNTRASE